MGERNSAAVKALTLSQGGRARGAQAFDILRRAQQTVLEHAALASQGKGPAAEAPAASATTVEEESERRVLGHRELEVPA